MLSVDSKYASACNSVTEYYTKRLGYHSSYYKNFTAVHEIEQKVIDPETVSTTHVSEKLTR